MTTTPDFIQPQSRLNEMKSFIQSGLEDCAFPAPSFFPGAFRSRSMKSMWSTCGVDALTNYITALGLRQSRYHDYEKFWPADVHFVGKEIVRFHAIIWPAMLMALNLPLPQKGVWPRLAAAGRWKNVQIEGQCGGPGGAVRPLWHRCHPLLPAAGGAPSAATAYSPTRRLSPELTPTLPTTLATWCPVPPPWWKNISAAGLPTLREDDPLDEGLRSCGRPARPVRRPWKWHTPSKAPWMEVMNLVKASNKYIDDTAPWVLGKDESKRARLATVLYNLIECIRIVSVFYSPFMPETSEKIRVQAGLGAAHCIMGFRRTVGRYPGGRHGEEGGRSVPAHRYGKGTGRTGGRSRNPGGDACAGSSGSASRAWPEITFDDFDKIQLGRRKFWRRKRSRKAASF